MAKDNETVNVNNISRISAGTVCKGEIHSDYDLRIDGGFEGKMYSKGRIVVGDGAIIKGDVICENIDLWGKLSGTVYVRDILSMKEGCSVNATVNVHKLVVELGSEFNGACKMIDEAEYEKAAKKMEDEFKGVNNDVRQTAKPADKPAAANANAAANAANANAAGVAGAAAAAK